MKRNFANTFGRILAHMGRNEMMSNGYYNTIEK